MPETYSRLGSILIKKETTENVAVIPNVSIPFNDEDIADDYGPIASQPVQGNRAMNIRALGKAFPAPVGGLNLNVEPKTFGHFLNSICGGVTSGVYFSLSDVDDLSVGAVLSNGSTGAATVAAILTDKLVVLCTSVSGDWATGNTVTSGSHSSTLGTFSSTVYGHLCSLPNNIDVTYSLQKNYKDRAIRYMGIKFHAIDAFAQSDNIMTAGVKLMARSAFHGARVLAAVTAGAGSKTITLDQTQGLVASDSIKVYRQGTGFLDFSAASVTTHTINSIIAETSINITNLQTALAIGDIIVLAPITPSYSIDDEFVWIGGSQIQLGSSRTSLADIDVQDYSMIITSELEERHAAQGTNFADRFPSDLLEKGFTANGTFTLHNENEDFYRLLRKNTDQAIELYTRGNQIGSTGLYYSLYVQFANVQFQAYDLNITQDDIIDEEVPFESYYDTTAGYCVRILLINDTSTY